MQSRHRTGHFDRKWLLDYCNCIVKLLFAGQFFLSSILLLLMKYTKQGTCFNQVDPELVAQVKWIFSHYLQISVLFLTYRFLSLAMWLFSL